MATLLGDRKLHEITTNLVEQYKVHRLTTPTERLKRPVSPRTVNGELRVLSSSLRYAAELEILRTPLPRMRQVPGRSPPKRYLTPDEVERLLEGAKSGDPRTWLLALVLANMGFRPSEAMTREWIDVENGIQSAAKRGGLEVAVHPHLFRHAWASRLAMAGVDRKSLQELGRWSDGRMLDEVYAHVTPDHLGAIMARSGIGGG